MSAVGQEYDPAILALVNDLVSAEHWADASFVRLPFVYPSGSSVTVKVERPSSDTYRVSDGGFAYRETEEVGAQRSFARTASAIAEDMDIGKSPRSLFIVVGREQLHRAVNDVAFASLQVATRVYSKIREEDEEEIAEYVADRLLRIFGADVALSTSYVGASTAPWEVTGVVKREGRTTVFQGVGAHANSVYRTNSAFDDLYSLETPPALVAVVRKFAPMGPKLALLSRRARILEEEDVDAAYERAALQDAA